MTTVGWGLGRLGPLLEGTRFPLRSTISFDAPIRFSRAGPRSMRRIKTCLWMGYTHRADAISRRSPRFTESGLLELRTAIAGRRGRFAARSKRYLVGWSCSFRWRAWACRLVGRALHSASVLVGGGSRGCLAQLHGPQGWIACKWAGQTLPECPPHSSEECWYRRPG